MVEARFRLGETLLANKAPAEAREAWQDLLDLHKGSASDLLPQAAFRMAETYQLPAPDDEEQLSLGVAALRRFLENFPQHALAAKAQLWIGQSYQHLGHHPDAAAALTSFLADERYAKAEEIPDALNLLGVSYKMQGKFDQALAAWKDFLAKHPTHPAWSAVQREIVNTEYAKAADRFQRKDYAAARQLWSEFLAKYPLDARSRATLFLLGQMSYAEEKWDAAISQWRQLVTKYPKTEEASRAQLMVARTLEEKLGKLDEALAEYRKLDWGKAVAGGPSPHRAADGQDHVDRHRACLPQRRDTAIEAGHAEPRNRHRAGLHGGHGNVLPQDARGPRHRSVGHRADRSGSDVRVQSARLQAVPAA